MRQSAVWAYVYTCCCVFRIFLVLTKLLDGQARIWTQELQSPKPVLWFSVSTTLPLAIYLLGYSPGSHSTALPVQGVLMLTPTLHVWFLLHSSQQLGKAPVNIILQLRKAEAPRDWDRGEHMFDPKFFHRFSPSLYPCSPNQCPPANWKSLPVQAAGQPMWITTSQQLQSPSYVCFCSLLKGSESVVWFSRDACF